MSVASGGGELSVVDAAAEAFLGVGQQDGKCRAFGVFEFDSDRVASASAVGQADVGDDGGRAQLVASFGQGGSAGVDHVARGGLSEWVGMLAELTRQIAAHELPDGCLAPTYEALTVAINQAAHRDHQQRSGRIHGFTPHPALPGRDDIIDAQLDTHTPDTAPARARQSAAIERSYRRRETRMRHRFGDR